MPFAFRCPHCEIGYQVKDETRWQEDQVPEKCGEAILLQPPETEITQGGSVVHRHALRDREIEIAIGDEELIEAIDKHIERYVGKPGLCVS